MFQNAFAFDKETDASLSQRAASCCSGEESSSDAALKISDLTTQWRLRDVEHPACPAKVQVFSHRDKIPQMAKFKTEIEGCSSGLYEEAAFRQAVVASCKASEISKDLFSCRLLARASGQLPVSYSGHCPCVYQTRVCPETCRASVEHYKPFQAAYL